MRRELLHLNGVAATEVSVISAGEIQCEACQAPFRIEGGMAHLLPSRLSAFDPGPGPVSDATATGGATEAASDLDKLRQMEFFRTDVDNYERNAVQSTFYAALDEITFGRWADAVLRPGMRVLELGCGTGRQLVELARRGIDVVGIDISREMLAVARQKLVAADLAGRAELIVGDAENPPLAGESFDACLIYGTLHHLPDPALAIRSAASLLKPGGEIFTLDPHKSPVRWIFDLMMRYRKLYDEEARDEPLLTARQLATWFEHAGIDGSTRYSTYLPPHALYPLSIRLNRVALTLSDAVFTRIPGISRLAGVIIGRGSKRMASSHSSTRSV